MARKWAKFPHGDASYAYAGAALKKAWDRLHRGDCEPFPGDPKVADAWRKFHAGAFQDAVERVRMRVVTLRVQACGLVDEADGAKWMTAGANRFRLRGDRDVPAGKNICADGSLDTSSTPPTFQISAFKENGR